MNIPYIPNTPNVITSDVDAIPGSGMDEFRDEHWKVTHGLPCVICEKLWDRMLAIHAIISKERDDAVNDNQRIFEGLNKLSHGTVPCWCPVNASENSVHTKACRDVRAIVAMHNESRIPGPEIMINTPPPGLVAY